MSNYAWRITKDYFADEDEEVGTFGNAVGVTGPRDASDEQIKAIKKGFKFRMLDDDGEVVYKGRLHVDNPVTIRDYSGNIESWEIEAPVAQDGAPYFKNPICSWPSVPEEAGFGPLWDFGTPNFGCTDIQYRCALPDGTLVWASL